MPMIRPCGQRLEALLRVHEEAIPFLENPPPGAQAGFGAPALAGADIPKDAGDWQAKAGTPNPPVRSPVG